MPPTSQRVKTALSNLLVADTLLVIAVLILVLRWGKLGLTEIVLVAASLAGAAIYFVKGIRTLLAGRKPPKSNEPERWDPIEP